MEKTDDVIDWLLGGEGHIRYRTLLDLQDRSEDDPEVVDARRDMLEMEGVLDIIDEGRGWPVRPLKRHNDAVHPLHRLCFLADIGVRKWDPGIDDVVRRIMSHRSKEGPYQVMVNIPVRFGGTGEDFWTWILCDGPLLSYMLLKMGWDGPEVREGVEYMKGMVRENGWPCASAPELGKFRGPGRSGDPCPYANLLMLKPLALDPEWRDGPEARKGVEAILDLWDRSREAHPYLFKMGTDFRKLKAPFVWYDILHVADVLTIYPWIRDDPGVREMIEIILSKADGDGRYSAESAFLKWKGWDFAQKRGPSRWITYLVLRLKKRMGGADPAFPDTSSPVAGVL